MHNHINKYIDIKYFLDIIKYRRITLTNIDNWDDKNDVYSIKKYIIAKKAKTALASCFTQKSDKYHFWKTYTNCDQGVRITFNKSRILDNLNNISDIHYSDVKYCIIKNLKNISEDDLPFLKRRHYSDEKEFRIIKLFHDDVVANLFYINIDIDAIEEIVFNPWINDIMYDEFKSIIKYKYGLNRVEILKTGIIDFKYWKNAIDNIR